MRCVLRRRVHGATMIRRCAELHMRQIAHGGDPFETGSARPLDYGHWSAHKLEGLTAHELRHGEAVAIGLALDTRYSVQIGMLAAGGRGSRPRAAGKARLPPLACGARTTRRRRTLASLRGLREFREHLGGELTITLLRDIGRGEEVHQMDSRDPPRPGLAASAGAGRVRQGAGVHLTYCSNIHPGESWAEVRANFDRHVCRSA